ncbi:hypothetical protein CSA37_04705 [Candidatus Fermentibacteria bacterium]|nr:MAG: hypothetical protein CSA37_04705 [Candidatus Fermentibacteria bacterium]
MSAQFILVFVNILAATSLPDAALIPGVSGETVVEGAEIEGRSWMRILETDYAVLRVSASPSVPMTAFDHRGQPLAVSTGGAPLVLSAYSDYWFWVRADAPEVDFSVEYVVSNPMSGSSVSSALGSEQMAEIWTFTPDREGKWSFFLRGNDDVSDLDLELYGPGNDLWASSSSNNSNEKFSMNLLAGEQVELIVSRYNKGGNGEYSLEAARVGDFPVLSSFAAGDAGSGNCRRFLLNPSEDRSFLELTYENQGDLDMFVRDDNGEIIYSSNTYFSSEGLLLPMCSSKRVVEVYPFEIDDELTAFPFSISLNSEATEITSGEILELPVEHGSSPLIEFTAPSTGFYRIAAEYEKLRDGDIRLFHTDGEPSVFITTERGDERFIFRVERDETVSIVPGFLTPGTSGLCRVSVMPVQPDPVTGLEHGTIDRNSDPQHFYTVRGEQGTTLVIELRGDQRELDLDMLVSGPDYVMQAEGGLSNTDSAADESVILYCSDDAVYGVTVYAYERDGEGTFTIETESIPEENLAQGSPEAETWAIVAGISGYSSRTDILSRASMDAIDVYRFLRDNQNIDPDHMILLIDAEATASAFENAMDDISRRAGSEDRLIIFYSGHGSQNPPGNVGPEEEDGVNEVLCFYDRDVTDDSIAELINDFSGYTYLFADACHSGGLVNDFSEDDNILVITAAREDLSVSERILTPILLEASTGAADSNNDGTITAEELVDHVDGMLSRICPVCDAVVDSGTAECPECGTVLKGEYRIPRPEQGLYLPADHPVWNQES